MYDPLPADVSPEARDLVKRLLVVDASQRMTMAELTRHPWVGTLLQPSWLSSPLLGFAVIVPAGFPVFQSLAVPCPAATCPALTPPAPHCPALCSDPLSLLSRRSLRTAAPWGPTQPTT